MHLVFLISDIIIPMEIFLYNDTVTLLPRLRNNYCQLTYLSSLPILAVVYRFFTFLPPTYRFTTIYRFLPIFSQIY